MDQNVILEQLDHNRRRLEYYSQLKDKTKSTKKNSPVQKWIEIYSERVQKLQRQAAKLAKQTQH